MTVRHTRQSVADEGLRDGRQATATRGLWWISQQPTPSVGPWWAPDIREEYIAPTGVRAGRRDRAKSVWAEWVAAGKPADAKLGVIRKRRELLDGEKPVWEQDTIVRRDGSRDSVLRLTPGDLHMEGVPTTA